MANPMSEMERRLLRLIARLPGLNAEELAQALGAPLHQVQDGLCLLVVSERVETLQGGRPHPEAPRARYRVAAARVPGVQAGDAERRLAPNLDLRRLVMAGNLMALQLTRIADALDAAEGADAERLERTLADAWERSLARLRQGGGR